MSHGEEAQKRLWLTKLKYVDEVVNPRDFESILYNKAISPIKIERKFFESGATIRLVDVDNATPAGLTNTTNDVPQWFVTTKIPKSKLKIYKKVTPQ